MTLPSLDPQSAAARLIGFWGRQLAGTFLAPGSSLSLVSLVVTLILAALFTLSRRTRPRPIRWRVLVRALFPRHLLRGRSSRADFGYFLFSLFGSGVLFGGAILTFRQINEATYAALRDAFGPMPPTVLPGMLCAALLTLATFIAYEFAYWLDHYLKHKVPLLWQFHKVHHSAETLSLLTNFRVHPLDTVLFYSLVALVVGVVNAALTFGFGTPVAPFALTGTNVLVLASAVLLTHLQHSHLWISFGAEWNRRLLSPAHHQIHHSADPRHYDRNFGSSLALWDRLFGTLHVPADRREPLAFGVPGLGYDPHGVKAALVMPFLDAGGGLARPFHRCMTRQIRVRALDPVGYEDD